MQRNLIIILILFSALAAEGCRRGGVKREPISVVKESDLIFSTKKSELADAVRPIVKDKKPMEMVKGADEQKHRAETMRLAEFLIQYRQNGKNKAPAYSYDDLKKSLRRQKKYDMYDDVNTRSIEVVYLADFFNPTHVVCYHRTAESQEDLTTKKSVQFVPMVRTEGKVVELVKQEEMDPRIKNQEMQVAFYYYMTYAAPHFYKQGPELDALRQSLVRQGEPFFLPADPPQGRAPEFLGKLQQRKPDLIKNPAEKRTYERFKKYLKENAPPLLVEYLETGTIVFDLNADLRTPGALVAVRGQPEPSKDQNNNQQKEKYHFGVTTEGVIQAAYESTQVMPWIELRRREQDTGKGGMMGGMPGTMPPGGMPPGMPPGGRMP